MNKRCIDPVALRECSYHYGTNGVVVRGFGVLDANRHMYKIRILRTCTTLYSDKVRDPQGGVSNRARSGAEKIRALKITFDFRRLCRWASRIGGVMTHELLAFGHTVRFAKKTANCTVTTRTLTRSDNGEFEPMALERVIRRIPALTGRYHSGI